MEKIKRLAKQMKRQVAWQTVSTKNGKNVANSSANKASTEAKPSSTEEKVFPKGNTSSLMATSTEVIKDHHLSKRKHR